MSETSRKRSRKSKLVPRQCAEVEDENVENLQVKRAKKKAKTSIKNNTAKDKAQNELNPSGIKTSHDDFEALIDTQKREETQPIREFSITVAVEECDENNTELLIVEPKQEPEIELSDDENENNVSKNEWYTLERDIILYITRQIMLESNNPADKILGLEVRTGLGRFPIHLEDPLENKIQNVLNRWQDTQRLLTPKQRSPPLFYKCYICEKSWWYLQYFREHLKEHECYFLHLEACTLYEVSVIATRNNYQSVAVKHFETKGNCPKCGYDFEIHKNSLNDRETAYICKVENCKKALPTCFMLRQHEYTFHTLYQLTGTIFSIDSWKKNCDLCGPMFRTQRSYNEHMELMHSVRSDLVIAWKEQPTCQSCGMKCVYGWHDCMKKRVVNRCNICKISFSNFLFPIHKEQGDYTCNICNFVLPKRCMETKHLLQHTNNFVLMQKCSLCTDFVVIVDNKESCLNHGKIYHKLCKKDEGIMKYLRTILIPKSCLMDEPISTMNLQAQIKEEPIDTTVPKIEIKQEIIDNYDDADNEDADIKIKEEIDLHDNFEASMRQEYNIKLLTPDDHSRIFGIKIEACEIETKQEISDEDYEDDIIKLDENFLNAIQESENMQDTQESEVDMQDQKRKPKLYQCTKCGYYGYHKDYRLHLKLDCQGKVFEKDNYTCTKCSTDYDMFQKYIEHLPKHNLNKLCCPECFREFSSYQLMLPHISMHIKMTFVTVPIITEYKKTAQFIYQCKICRDKVEKSEFFQHWEAHLTFAGENKKDKKEDETEDGSPSAKAVDQLLIQELLQHLQSPEVTYMKRGCLICHRHFERKNDCKRHLIEHLLTDAYTRKHQNNALKCQICPKTFQKPDKYKKHMRDHGSLPEYRCDLCDKSFSDSSNFTKHKKIHNMNAYTCDTCGKKFQAKISLEKHIELHQNQVPIECVPCNKTFYLSSAYKKHYRMHHEKCALRFNCNYCSIRFKCLKDKWDHMWYVHKERKHKADCTKCNTSYRRFMDLKNHMKTEHQMDVRFLKAPNRKVIPGKRVIKRVISVPKVTKKGNPVPRVIKKVIHVPQVTKKGIPVPKVIKSNQITANENPTETIASKEPAETLVVFEES